MRCGDALTRGSGLCRCSTVLVLAAVLLCGCGSQQSRLQEVFPAEFVAKARLNFNTDLTDWEIPAGWTAPRRAWLFLWRAPGVDAHVERFCEQKLTKCLTARGFEIDPAEQTRLTICILKAAEIRKPVRSAKVRMAVKFSSAGDAEPAMLGIADGIVPRPDLSSGVWMPKSAYCRAAQFAISKLMDQLDNLPKNPPLDRSP